MHFLLRETNHLHDVRWRRLLELAELLEPWASLHPLPEKLRELKGNLAERLSAEDADRHLHDLQSGVRKALRAWESSLNLAGSAKPHWNRLLRQTEDLGIQWASRKWPKPKSDTFFSLSAVFSAYQESPLWLLTSTEPVVLRDTAPHVCWQRAPFFDEIEESFMRGCILMMRPSTQISRETVGKATRWSWRLESAH